MGIFRRGWVRAARDWGRASCLMMVACVNLLCGCVVSGGASYSEKGVQNGLVWPKAPERARIEWVGTLREPADLGIRPGLFSRIVGWVAGSGTIVMRRPHGVSVDPEGRLWLTDPGAREVYIFDVKKNRSLRIPKPNDSALGSPIAIAHDSKGISYVSDSAFRNIRLFDGKGNPCGTWDAEGALVRPTGLAFDPRSELLWVVDTGKHNILALDQRGEIVRTVGRRGEGPGEFNFPTHIVIDETGRLYVADTLNFRVQVFTAEGAYLRSFGEAGDGPGTFAKPKGIARDSDGHIYLADGSFDNVQIFDEEGQLLLAFGDHGSERGQFRLPAGLWIDPNDRIYVVDAYNRRVQMFRYLKRQD